MGRRDDWLGRGMLYISKYFSWMMKGGNKCDGHNCSTVVCIWHDSACHFTVWPQDSHGICMDNEYLNRGFMNTYQCIERGLVDSEVSWGISFFTLHCCTQLLCLNWFFFFLFCTYFYFLATTLVGCTLFLHFLMNVLQYILTNNRRFMSRLALLKFSPICSL